MSSSTGCQFVLDDKTVFYLESGTEIIINSYYTDEDGTQFIKACLLDGGFYFKTLRKIKRFQIFANHLEIMEWLIGIHINC